MAPTAPKKRTSIRAKTSKPQPSTTTTNTNQPIHLPPTHREGAILTDGFLNNKADKRLIKRSAFVNRIEKTRHAKPLKRRRPSKKLVATLESLADALPDASELGEQGRIVGQATIRHKSMRSRPGATRRREKLERSERERFQRNMAQMMGGVGEKKGAEVGDEEEGTRRRWGALRGFIEQTLERKPEFVGK